ncbi:3-isopropylmalate dehydratase large subunit [Pseudomonas agarici]|uniref:3-isopropylmalate dehydratase large subunit n=1 Tax=Pseudomonas agarici TaxID=46677 RepID=A0A0X1T3I9_PSEAA|nr:3-isopropylmalate dehydratase large subunit [Pseudomonas agarici]
MTIAEKILSRSLGRTVEAGELVICQPDFAMGTDGSIPMALDYLKQMTGGLLRKPRYPERLLFALDHYGAASGTKALGLQELARDYAKAHCVAVADVGQGIGHQLVMELGHARPGRIMVGADSHSTSYGAFNAFATGIGSSDLAGILLCGQVWFKVPASIRVVLHGRLTPGVAAKDLALHLARHLRADGANYCALEFAGVGVGSLDMDDRIVLANMAVEMGAKVGLFPCDQLTHQWLAALGVTDYQPVEADADARYLSSLEVDLGQVRAQVALPHRVDNVIDVRDVSATKVDMVYLGTCTGGRVKDYREALVELQARGGIAKGVQLVVTPASEAVRAQLASEGLLAAFEQMGATIQPPGCGSCCGTCGVIPASQSTVLSTANRNFKGRMGNAEAAIYLASPRVCAIAAATGELNAEGVPV